MREVAIGIVVIGGCVAVAIGDRLRLPVPVVGRYNCDVFRCGDADTARHCVVNCGGGITQSIGLADDAIKGVISCAASTV